MAQIKLPSQARLEEEGKGRFTCKRIEANVNEIRDVPYLLTHLCRIITGPEWKGFGPVPLPYRDRLYCVILTEFFTHSVPRSEPHYQDARDKGHITRAPSFNSVYDYYDDRVTTGFLHKLLRISGKVLKEYDTDVLMDGTHFVTEERLHYADDEKYKNHYSVKKAGGFRYLMAHFLGGPMTHGVFAAAVDVCLDKWFRPSHDSKFTEILLQRAKSNGFDFRGAEVWGDKGYAGGKNKVLIESLGAKPMITAKDGKKHSHPHGDPRLCGCEGCYKRNQIETIHSMIKQIMGEKVFSKNEVSLENEVLARVVAHNLRVIQQAMIAWDIPVDFEAVAKADLLQAAMKSRGRLEGGHHDSENEE